MSKQFVDALENGHDSRAAVNLHNNEAGRLVSDRSHTGYTAGLILAILTLVGLYVYTVNCYLIGMFCTFTGQCHLFGLDYYFGYHLDSLWSFSFFLAYQIEHKLTNELL